MVFCVLFGLSLFAEFIANDKPILVNYRGDYFFPIFTFYPETAFGGDFRTEAVYGDIEVQCLIVSGGLEECFDDPEGVIAEAGTGELGRRTGRARLDALAADPLQLRHDQRHRRRRALAAGRRPHRSAPTTPRATCWRG